jgi:hypothetical protein
MQQQTCAAIVVQLSLCSIPVDNDFQRRGTEQLLSNTQWHTVGTIFRPGTHYPHVT